MIMVMEIIAIILSMLLFCCMGQRGFEAAFVSRLVDVPTLICILILSLPILFKKGLAKDFGRAFLLLNPRYTCDIAKLRMTLDVVELMQKQVLCAGFIVTVQGICMLMLYLGEPLTLGSNLTVTLLGLLYTAFLELLLLPLQIEAKRRIVEYMQKE